MKEKIELKNSPAPGFVEGLWNFLKLLEEMESKKETVRSVSGELEGPFDSKAAYDYTVKLGIEEDDCVSVVAYLPHIREEDIELNIANNELKKKNKVR